MSTTTTAPPDLAVQAALLARAGTPLGKIASELEISTETARGMVQDGKRILDQRAQITTTAPPTPVAKPDSDRDVMRWARDESSPARAHQLAARIHVMLRELRELKDKHDQAAGIRQRLAEAEEKVATYRAELKALQSGQNPSALSTAGTMSGREQAARQESQIIRDWARQNGWPNIGVAGVIAKPVREAYEAYQRSTP